MLNLNLLFELATSKCDHFKTQIADNIRTAGTIENPTIPITHIIADTSEMTISATQDAPVFAVPPKVQEPPKKFRHRR